MSGENEESGAPAASTADTESVKWEDLNSTVPGIDDHGDDEGDEEESSSDASEGSDEAPSDGASDDEGDTPVDAASTADAVAGGTENEEGAAPVTESVAEEVQELTPEQIAKRQSDYQEWLNEQRKGLETVYKLDDETAEQLQTEPELVLPKLLANMHLNLQRSLLEGMQQIVPQMLEKTQKVSARERQAVDTFYGAYPELKPHHDKVLEIGKTYRQLNPKATPQEATKAIGLLAAQMLGVELKGGKSAGQKKATPHTPVRPAGKGGALPASGKKSGDNIFADLLDD